MTLSSVSVSTSHDCTGDFVYAQVDLQFSPEALYAVAERAKEQKTGARGLRSIVVRQLQVEETHYSISQVEDCNVPL